MEGPGWQRAGMALRAPMCGLPVECFSLRLLTLVGPI